MNRKSIGAGVVTAISLVAVLSACAPGQSGLASTAEPAATSSPATTPGSSTSTAGTSASGTGHGSPANGLAAQDVAMGSGQQTAANGLMASGGESFDGFMTSVVNDVADYWQGQFAIGAQTGQTPQWTPVKYRIVDGTGEVASGCQSDGGPVAAGDSDDDPAANPAFWCPDDRTVYLSSQWLYDHIWNGAPSSDGLVSDFGVAYAIAHELGHAVQTELNIQPPATAQTVSGLELQADCLAGVWSNAKYYQDALDSDDVQQAVAAASSVGDDNFTNPGHHGTSDQRVAAFMIGYNTGTGKNCTLTLDGAY